MCSLSYVAGASGSAEVDTWPLIHGSGCYHATEVGRTVRFVRLALKCVI